MRVVLWDVVTQARLMDESFNSPVQAVYFSPSSSYFAVADADSFVTLWNARTLGEETSTEVDGDVMSVAMNSGVLAVGANLQRVVLLSVPDLTDTAELQHDGDVRSLSFSPFGDMLAGGGADDMHGLMRHKTRGSEMKVVIWRITENVSVDMDSLSRVVSKINSPWFHIDRLLSPREECGLGCRKELTASQQPKYSREGGLMAIMTDCRLPRTKAVALSLSVLSGGAVFRPSWFP